MREAKMPTVEDLPCYRHRSIMYDHARLKAKVDEIFRRMHRVLGLSGFATTNASRLISIPWAFLDTSSVRHVVEHSDYVYCQQRFAQFAI